MDFSEKWGTSVDEAVRLALIDLKLTIDEVDVIVLEEPSKGFFGLGSKLAKVRVEKKAPIKKAAVKEEPVKFERTGKPERTKTQEKEKPFRQEKPERSEKPERLEKTEKTEKIETQEKPVRPEKKEGPKPARKERERRAERVTQERPADLKPVTEHAALVFLKELTEKMGLSVEIKADGNEEVLYIDMEGKDSGTVIGKRGQTLDAVQYLTSLVVNKDTEKYVRVVVDAENYRAKREKTLEQLANRLADKVIRTKKSVRLEPMNPYERKVIHATLQSNSKITTRSEGEEPYRRVIIELK